MVCYELLALSIGGCQGSCRLNVLIVSISPSVRSAWQSWAAWPDSSSAGASHLGRAVCQDRSIAELREKDDSQRMLRTAWRP